MFGVSQQFLTALTASHDIAVRAEVWSGLPDQKLLTTLTKPSVLIDGSVTVDVNNAFRRSCTVTLIDPDGALAAAGSVLTPYGNELRLYRGITYPPVPDDLVPLGVFGLSTIEIDDDPAAGLTIQLGGYDRARKIARAKLTDSYTIAAGVDYTTAIQTLIASRVAGITFSFPPLTGATTPAMTLNAGDDPWQQAQQMAASIGYDLHFDPQGVCVLTPIVNPQSIAASFTYAEGKTATILKSKRTLTDEQTFNDVIASGNSTSNTTPPTGRAQDIDPASPTYIGGQYGDVVEFYTSDLITTSAQALAAAQGMLYRSIGLAEQIQFDALVNPAHDGGDVIRITRARSGVDDTYVIDSLTVPLRAEVAMTATTRLQTT
jgi:hypothetical protein